MTGIILFTLALPGHTCPPWSHLVHVMRRRRLSGFERRIARSCQALPRTAQSNPCAADGDAECFGECPSVQTFPRGEPQNFPVASTEGFPCSTQDRVLDDDVGDPLDLLLVDPDQVVGGHERGAEELCATIQQLRHGATGHNPFVVILVTAWEKNTQMINRVISSGADDLLLRPFSTAHSP